MKRTTLILEDGIIDGIRSFAHDSSLEMTEVVNTFLREGLQRRQQFVTSTIKLPSFKMGKPKVNLADRDALEMMME